MDFGPRDYADSRDRDGLDIYDSRWLDDPRDRDDRERELDRDRERDPLDPPWRRACNQLKSAVRAPPTCR